MYLDVIIAGFGGQGVLLMGNLLAYAAMSRGLNVTFLPVYGPEMRGGTANCTVVISDEEIGSPLIRRPLSLIAMNRPSLDKFQPRLQDGGLLVQNSSLVDPTLADVDRVRAVMVDTQTVAEAQGNARLANMVALGTYVAASGVVPVAAVIDCLPEVISAHYAKLIPANAAAITAGAELVAAHA